MESKASMERAKLAQSVRIEVGELGPEKELYEQFELVSKDEIKPDAAKLFSYYDEGILGETEYIAKVNLGVNYKEIAGDQGECGHGHVEALMRKNMLKGEAKDSYSKAHGVRHILSEGETPSEGHSDGEELIIPSDTTNPDWQ